MPKKKKKILYLVTQAEWGGAQKYIYDLAQNLANDFDITVGAGLDGSSQELLNKLESIQIKTTVFKNLKRSIHPLFDLLAILEIFIFLKKNRFEIIHLNSSKAGVIGSVTGWIYNLFRKNKIKILYTAHGWVYSEPLSFCKRYLYLWTERIACLLRDATIVLSEKEKSVGLKYKTVKEKTVTIIPNGIDLNKIYFLDREQAKRALFPKRADQDIIIGTIANLYKTKGLDILIHGFKNIYEQNNNCRLIIIGEGPERQVLEKIIVKENLQEAVILTGRKENAAQYLKAFDIFVLPSIKEGFPYALLEAMTAGLPIIATQVGAIPEIIKNGSNGILVETGQEKGLAGAIQRLLNYQELRNTIGQTALQDIANYSLQKMIKETKEIYE